MSNSIGQTLQNIVNSAAQAAGEAKTAVRAAGKNVAGKYDTVKLRLELARLEDAQEDIFSDLGRMLFLIHTGAVGETVQSDEGEKTPQQVINALLIEAEQLQQEQNLITEKLKIESDARLCPCCGRLCGESDRFCAVCGTRLDSASKAGGAPKDEPDNET